MLAAKIVEAVRSVIGDGPHALHEPLFIGNEQKYVADAIASGWVAQGEYIERFEQMLCDFTGAKHCITTSSCTTALYASLQCSGYRRTDEISLCPLTFVATANAIAQGDSYIRFVEPEDASLPVHLLGHPAPVNKGYVRDAAQALGSSLEIDGLVCFSFNGNKIITTGGGGAVVTNDDMMAKRIRHRITTARLPHPWKIEHDQTAWNYRLPNLNAALGCAQMEQLPNILKAKRALAMKYQEAFDAIEIHSWKEREGTTSNYWLNAITLDDPADQEPTLQALHDAGYMARMLPTPLHLLPMFKACPRSDMREIEELWRRTICLPSSPKLGVQYA